MKITGNRQELYNFFYNLNVGAPGKADAKKTVSGGTVYVTKKGGILTGLSTDDHFTVRTQAVLDSIEGGKHEVILSIDTIKEMLNELSSSKKDSCTLIPKLEVIDPTFVDKFWRGHVLDSIVENVKAEPVNGFKIPQRVARKFSLLKPDVGIDCSFVEWSDRTIVRFKNGDLVNGIWAPPLVF